MLREVDWITLTPRIAHLPKDLCRDNRVRCPFTLPNLSTTDFSAAGFHLRSDAMTLAILILYIINQFSSRYESHGITLIALKSPHY